MQKDPSVCRMTYVYGHQGTPDTLCKVAENLVGMLQPSCPTDFSNPLDTQYCPFNWFDFANMPIEKLKAVGEFVSVLGDAYVMMSNAREKETIARTAKLEAIGGKIEKEKELLREKRVAASAPRFSRKQKRARVEPILNQHGPRSLQRRRSISHVILEILQEEMGSHRVPPFEDLFAVVNGWFIKQKEVAKCKLYTRTVFITDVPVVYGWPEGHKHTFFNTHHFDRLLQHVTDTMFPNEGMDK